MEQSINLREYIDMFKRRKFIVIFVMLISLGLGIYKTYQNYISYVPTYRSTITVRINTSKQTESKKSSKDKDKDKDKDEEEVNAYSSTYNISLNQNIATTYNSLASSQAVVNIVASTLKIPSSDVGSITVTQREDMAEFLDISVINRDPKMAKKVVEKVPEAFNEELIRLVGFDCVEVVYDSSEPALIGRSTDLTALKYIAVGMVLSIFLVLLRECLDTKIVTPDDVNKYWDYQLIGTIPLDKESLKGKQKVEA